jgi:hypothetical protein
VALKKPSDFFNNKKDPLDEIKEIYDAACPEKIEQVSEAFDVFKSNLNHIQSLSDFTNTFDSFKENLEKVETVSEEISTIKEDLKELIKKEELDSAMMAQLLFVQESISKIESKISSINGETVDKIKEDFSNLSNSVESFIDIDVPKYKNLVSESEVRVDDRFVKFKEEIKENFDSIKSDTSKEVASALETVESLNENIISDIKSDFRKTTKEVNNTVSDLVEKELPKYKKFFAETELRTEEKIKTSIDSYQETIDNLNTTVKEFTENEIPKYNNLLIENKIKSEKEVKELEEQVLSRVNSVTEKLESLSENIDKKASDRFEELQTVVGEYKEEINSISKTYESLYKDFKKREVYENKKLEDYSGEIQKFDKKFRFIEETVKEDLNEIQNVLIQSNETYHTSLKKEVGKFRNKISEQMKDLELDLVVNEKHIKKQNDNIESIQEEIKEVLERLQLDTLEEKNKELVEKITCLEETISEINEKKLLIEDNPTLPGDANTNNSADPLTPLNQKFATLDDLQNHYRTFINRIQQQIATIGGGGAGFIKDLDDVTFDQTVGEGKLLIYNGSKWVGIASTAVGGGDASKLSENTTGTNLVLSGNLTVAGIATYEDVRNIDSIGIVTARSGINVLAGGITAVGVVTATSFIGDGSGLSNIISGVGIQSGSVRVGTGFTDVKFTGAGVTIVGSGTTVTVNIPFSTITRQTETSSGVTTNFTITGGYEVGLIDVFLNGIKQRSGVDFTATNGSVVTMTPFISDGDVVEFQKIDQLTIAGITSVTNATNAYNIIGGVGYASSAGISTNSSQLNGQAASYYLDYNNFSNTPTVPTNNNQLTNGAGFITTSFTNTNQLTNGAGFITATSSGTGLTGIVTSIVAGTNVTISGSTGVVTINSSGGGGSSGIEVFNNGSSVGTGITSINFSTNVTATASGGIATVTASGGGGGSGPDPVIMGMIF